MYFNHPVRIRSGMPMTAWPCALSEPTSEDAAHI